MINPRRITQKGRRAAARLKRNLRHATVPKAISGVTLPAVFSIDSPLQAVIDKKTVMVEGWIIPKSPAALLSVQARQGKQVVAVPHGLKRVDVFKAFPNEPNALHSGFSVEISVEDGPLYIEADFGAGYKTLHIIDLRYSPELLVADVYNPELAMNWAEHLNLIENKKKYFYELDNGSQYKRHQADPRLISFYLPQYHPIAENDHVWGSGFTEWTNVTGDTPRFVGHMQPILPKDTGFYDLRLEQNISDQIQRAKDHGIYGFCFYYYWFSGKRLLERPLNSFLNHHEWDFNFTICWANENWTKRWDGRDSEVIVAQKYEPEDPLRFIKDVEHILLDPRYITENGRPVLIVFRASELKQPEVYAQVWRDYFRKKHQTELHLVSIVSFEDRDPREYGFDAALDFAPQSSFFKNDAFEEGRYPYLDVSKKLIDIRFSGSVADYRQIALNQKTYSYFDFPTYKSVTPSWDNDARKKGKGFVMSNESPDVYASWLDNILAQETKQATAPMVFINAWNEWAEGAVLEPTAHYGSAVLNRTTEVLTRYSHNKANKELFTPWDIHRHPQTEIAVVVHLYYPDRWELIHNKLTVLSKQAFDLFITLNSKDSDFAEVIRHDYPSAYIYIVPNRGRDILPFVHLAHRLATASYQYFLKIHSKKSLWRSDGDSWFNGVLDGLLPDQNSVAAILKSLRQQKAVMVGPAGHTVSLQRHMGSNENELRRLLSLVYDDHKLAAKIIDQRGKYNYFGGSMFWVSAAAMKPMLDLHLLPEDFQSESGQIDGTTAHAIERLMGVMAYHQDGCLYTVMNGRVIKAPFSVANQKYEHAP